MILKELKKTYTELQKEYDGVKKYKFFKRTFKIK